MATVTGPSSQHSSRNSEMKWKSRLWTIIVATINSQLQWFVCKESQTQWDGSRRIISFRTPSKYRQQKSELWSVLPLPSVSCLLDTWSYVYTTNIRRNRYKTLCNKKSAWTIWKRSGRLKFKVTKPVKYANVRNSVWNEWLLANFCNDDNDDNDDTNNIVEQHLDRNDHSARNWIEH